MYLVDKLASNLRFGKCDFNGSNKFFCKNLNCIDKLWLSWNMTCVFQFFRFFFRKLLNVWVRSVHFYWLIKLNAYWIFTDHRKCSVIIFYRTPFRNVWRHSVVQLSTLLETITKFSYVQNNENIGYLINSTIENYCNISLRNSIS